MPEHTRVISLWLLPALEVCEPLWEECSYAPGRSAIFRHGLFGLGMPALAAARRQFRAGIGRQAQEGEAGERRNRRDAEEGDVEIGTSIPPS